MKVYSNDAHPIAKMVVNLVHDTNAACSNFHYIIKELEQIPGTASAIARIRSTQKKIQGATDSLYSFISEHQEL